MSYDIWSITLHDVHHFTLHASQLGLGALLLMLDNFGDATQCRQPNNKKTKTDLNAVRTKSVATYLPIRRGSGSGSGITD